MNSNNENRVCPSLGLKEDAETSLAFPSIWNCCHHSRPIAPPKLKHQGEYCLCENYRECPVFLSQQTAPLPGHIRAPHTRVKKPQKNSWKNIVLVLTVIAGVLILGWGFVTRGSFVPLFSVTATPTASATIAPTATETSLPTETATQLPTPTLTATVEIVVSGSVTVTRTSTSTPTSTRTATRTPTSIPTFTLTPILSLSKHQLDQPIGTDVKFVIHKVLDGENLNQYAAKYNTSVDAIVAVSYKLKTPVWGGMLLVIPVGFTDVSSLPSFQSYQVTDANTTIESLAQELGVALADLKKYNAIHDGDVLAAGDWLLIPRPRPAP